MFEKKVVRLIILIFALISVIVFLIWFLYNPVDHLSVSLPGLDNRPPRTADTAAVVIGEKFNYYATEETNLKGKWPNFRGPDYDNINKEKIPLIDKFPKGGPKVMWSVDLGEGHAAPAIYNGKVFVLDYNEIKKADALRCFSLKTGTELWKRWYNVHVKRNHGMSRTIPAVNDKYVVTIGPNCQVMCTGVDSGNFVWGIDLVKEYDTEVPFWHTGQCPLIDSNRAIIATGGKALLIAVDLKTGKVVWETPNPEAWKMSHSSIVPITYKNKKMYVYASLGGVFGVSAYGSDAGKVLWQLKEFAPSVIAPSPVYLGDGRIFITAGYGEGGTLFQISGNGNNYTAKVLQKYLPKDGVCSEQQTPILYKGYMFAILPKDAGGNRNQLVACKPNDTKNILFTAGKDVRFGLGPYIVADDKFYIVDDDGTLTIAKFNGTAINVLDKYRVIEGQDAWGPIAIADGRLIMRDSKKMVCLDIRKNN